MKLERLPHLNLDNNILIDFAWGKYKNFLTESDSKYWYWNEFKYHKEITSYKFQKKLGANKII